MARWLLGLKNDVLSAQKTFRMLNAFIVNKGDLLQQGRLNKAEMSWLRLQAGCSMLKICEQKGVGDQYTAEQFYNLSQLMVVSIFLYQRIDTFILIIFLLNMLQAFSITTLKLITFLIYSVHLYHNSCFF
jgi:hypothetical protein